MQNKGMLLCLVMAAILGFLSANLMAQEASSSDQSDEESVHVKRRLPLLNGHSFIPSLGIPQTPFVTTFFRNSTGAGNALGREIPIYDKEGEIINTLNASITYMILSLAYQQAVNDWLAFSIEASGVGRVGTNAESILSQGVSALAAIELGGLARIWQNDKMILSAAASLRSGKLIAANIIGFAKSIIDTGIIDPNNLYQTIPSTRWKGGLRFAYAPSDLLGLRVFADYGSGDSLAGEEKNDTVFEIGGLASLDLNTRTVLPIGFALGLRYTSYPEGAGDFIDSATQTSLRIAYTGRREFSLGIEAIHSTAPLTGSDNNLKMGSIAINVQYFF